ncbi:phosphoribosylformylglycinamidine synthase subunit PurQ [Candidatus Kaiserbacteria bacterium]|nr:phosphoribosylformylglycinamidine synthase subunit PurQ [Candidatus Kaiserbacteria bacterium]
MTALKAKSSKLKARPKVLVFAGYGLNCEEETKFAFDYVGAEADIVHINDLIENPKLFAKYQIAAVPGGFAYGDDLGSGRAYGLKLKNHLGKELEKFLERDTLMIGICNGFQVLTASGILPGALLENSSNRYLDRWVDLKVTGKSPWLKGIKKLSIPIAHGEGRYFMQPKELAKLKKEGRIALKYEKGEMAKLLNLPGNPNGAIADIAGITGYNGRVLGLMPHPERGMFFTQRPDWTNIREKLLRAGKPIPTEAVGIEIFRNAVKYFV